MHGIVRRASVFNTDRIDHLYHDPHDPVVRMFLHYGDFTDAVGLRRVFYEVMPDEVSTLDRVFSGMELRGPVLLKLDVQGYEARVVRGGAETVKRVDYVVLEASFRRMYEGEQLFADIMRLMEEHGFRFERPVGWLTAPGTARFCRWTPCSRGKARSGTAYPDPRPQLRPRKGGRGSVHGRDGGGTGGAGA